MTDLRLAAVAAVLALSSPPAQALSVHPTADPAALAGVLVGSGITILPGSTRYSGAEGAAGTFTGGLSSGIGIERGILLTTGLAELAVGPNDNSSEGLDHGDDAGDSDLTGLAGYPTFDAAALEFDFESAGGDLYFNYVFASEEYNEYSNSQFNDLFAFFLDGRNLALLPGTDTPVGVNTVNRGNPTIGTPPANPQYFVDNEDTLDDEGNWLAPRFDLEYDGFTVVLTAQALGLAPGSHRIRLAIADASDGAFDSAVFLQASTFSDTATQAAAPEPGTLTLLGSGLGLLAARLSRGRA